MSEPIEEKDQPGFYSVTPAFVRYDKELVPNAKLLYGEITALCNDKGYCWAKNGYFAELYDVHKNTVSSWISMLRDKGYIIIKDHVREDGSIQRRIYLPEIVNRVQEKANRVNKNVDPPKQNNLPPSMKSLTPINENVDHNTTTSITTNTTKGNIITAPAGAGENHPPNLVLEKEGKNNLSPSSSPPQATVPQTKVAAPDYDPCFTPCKEIYLKKFPLYEFRARDGNQLKLILNSIRFKITAKGQQVNEELVQKSWKYLLDNLPPWNLDNNLTTLSDISSGFEKIYAHLHSKKSTNGKNQSTTAERTPQVGKRTFGRAPGA